jgi:hypothetical protein
MAILMVESKNLPGSWETHIEDSSLVYMESPFDGELSFHTVGIHIRQRDRLQFRLFVPFRLDPQHLFLLHVQDHSFDSPPIK